MRGAANCIFNVKYTKEEYAEKVKELGLNSWTKLRGLEDRAHKFWQTLPHREYNGHSLNLNVTGEYVYESKNSKEMYIVIGAENCKWCQFITVPTAKDCMDYSGWGNNSSLIYECATVGENMNSVCFSDGCFPDGINLQYCSWNVAGKNNLGCFNLKRRQYCILNKQYSKEEHKTLREKILEDMKENPYVDKLGRKFCYGEFFPPEFSHFAYNKSNAMRFFPKTKEEAVEAGYNWSDREDTVYQISKVADSLPERIIETGEDILNEVIGYQKCGKGYKIAKGEYNLLRKMNLPIPHECPKCRENRRFSRLNKPKLYNRTCQKCQAPIYTPYAPDDPRMVYCVRCYQQEFA